MIEKKKEIIFFFFFFFEAIKFTESAAFCRVGRVTGNNNKFLLGLNIITLEIRVCKCYLLGSHSVKLSSSHVIPAATRTNFFFFSFFLSGSEAVPSSYAPPWVT